MAQDLFASPPQPQPQQRSGPRDLLAATPDKRAGQGQGSSFTLSEGWKALDDSMRSVASGMTFGFADELAAGASSVTGVGEQPGGQGDYSSNLAAERARDATIPPEIAIPGQVAGGLATGLGAGRAGLTLLKGARPTVASMAGRGAAEGAVYGGLYGAGHAEGGPQERAEGAAWGSLLGSLTGAAVGAAGGAVSKAGQPKPPAVAALKSQAGEAYDTALNTGVTINGARFATMADDMVDAAQKEGFHPKIHPKVSAALEEFTKTKGQAPTLQQVDNLRRILKQASGSIEKAERRLAQQLIGQLDDTLDRLTPGDVVAGNVKVATEALRDARSLWSRASKGETIEALIARAHDRAAQYSTSGMENALRTEFRQLAMNAKKMRLFSQEEQQAIKMVSQGEPITNVLRFVGKFAPRGLLSGGFQMGATAVNPVLGAATLGAAELGRAGATAMTRGAAQAAAELARSGGASAGARPLSAGQVNALRSMLLAPIPAESNVLSTLRRPSTAR